MLNIFAVAFFTCAVFSCNAQQQSLKVEILSKQNASKDRLIKYKIFSQSTLYYYVSLEKLLDNKWREIVLDINAEAPDRAAIVNTITKEKPVISNYKFKNIPVIYSKNGHQYRLKINFGDHPTDIRNVAYSDSFDAYR
ncbi:hypothetical protein [Mucilaginibacter sp. KACC 22063]|uniref:hypothetical protein n=1 Tax=Mucilaginibacter sp. KACC 22063 TaxID=3025666 RepID=UPI0023672849|nr:hypothetical protein [Mucilaginibacter sp. KACC 22063]WDF56359.1 hypothetical protein PQ461_04725 [Mucilaginibacter sp. KACC 22063]